MLLTDPGIVPVPISADGRKASISDGFHARGDMRFRNGVGHRGSDWMYRMAKPVAKPNHPWQSKWYEMLPHTPALAVWSGTVTVAKMLATGFAVALEHGSGRDGKIETAHHHMSALLVKVGQVIDAGAPVGIIGGSPIGYGLVHLHHDLLVNGKFVDEGPYARKWRHVAVADPGSVPWTEEKGN